MSIRSLLSNSRYGETAMVAYLKTKEARCQVITRPSLSPHNTLLRIYSGKINPHWMRLNAAINRSISPSPATPGYTDAPMTSPPQAHSSNPKAANQNDLRL